MISVCLNVVITSHHHHYYHHILFTLRFFSTWLITSALANHFCEKHYSLNNVVYTKSNNHLLKGYADIRTPMKSPKLLKLLTNFPCFLLRTKGELDKKSRVISKEISWCTPSITIAKTFTWLLLLAWNDTVHTKFTDLLIK